jgi:Right handed beta helix region
MRWHAAHFLKQGATVVSKNVFVLPLLAALLACLLPAVPANAQNGTLTRSFVSSSGVDGNPCTIAQPCATFAQAYTKVGANGIVAALDPGKYGPLTITGPVTINGNGWAAITGTAQSAGITINAVSGNVILIGLEIDGAGAAFYGIVFNSGSSLTVTNCTLQNFAAYGIFMQPSSGPFDFAITNTTVSNNGQNGIYYAPNGNGPVSASGLIDHVIATANEYGIVVYFPGTTILSVSNSVVSNNSGGGVQIQSLNSPIEALISDSHIDANTQYGFFVSGNGGANTSVIVRNVTVNQTTNPIQMFGYVTLWLSQVTEAIVPGFLSNNGGIIASGSNNAVFSDGTNHLGSSAVAIQNWSFQ